MKYVLFLGGGGFLGKNVLAYHQQYLETADPLHFIVVGRQMTNPMEILPGGSVTYYPADFSDRTTLEPIFERYTFDAVFHFVSATVPANSNQEIVKDIETNLLGTVALLELMVRYKVPKIVYMSSGGAIYGDSAAGGSGENDFNNPNNSYGIVKLTIEKYILLFSKLHGLQYLIIRLSNPFGPYHTSERNGIINIAIRKAIRKEPVVVWGDGLNTKDYIFAPDFAAIFWRLYQQQVHNLILNIGSGQLHSTIDILEYIQKIAPELHWTFEAAKSFDTRTVAFKLDALRSILPFDYTDFPDALKTTYDWEYSRLYDTSRT